VYKFIFLFIHLLSLELKWESFHSNEKNYLFAAVVFQLSNKHPIGDKSKKETFYKEKSVPASVVSVLPKVLGGKTLADLAVEPSIYFC